jgi:hypothetical protein
MEEGASLAVEVVLSFFEWALSDASRCLITVSGVLEEGNLGWDGLGVIDFSSISDVFGDMAFIEAVSPSSRVSDNGGVEILETALGFRLGRSLKEVFVLLDVKVMLLSVPTGELSSKASDEDSVAKEGLLLLEGPADIVFSSLLLEVFFLFLFPCLLFCFGFSVATSSQASDWILESVEIIEVGLEFFLISAADVLSMTASVRIPVGCGWADVDLYSVSVIWKAYRDEAKLYNLRVLSRDKSSLAVVLSLRSLTSCLRTERTLAWGGHWWLFTLHGRVLLSFVLNRLRRGLAAVAVLIV